MWGGSSSAGEVALAAGAELWQRRSEVEDEERACWQGIAKAVEELEKHGLNF